MEIIYKKLIFEIADAPTPSCHASSIEIYKGNLYAVWFGGTKEGADDVAIWLSLMKDDKWSVPVRMSQSHGIPHWNPVLFALDKRLFLYYKKGKTIPKWQTVYRVLENGVWSDEAELVPGDHGGRGPVKNKPVQLRNGLIVAGASVEGTDWKAFIDASTDGITWHAQEFIEADVNLIQPTIWETDYGIHALMRSNTGRAYRSDFDGKNWSKACKTNLPNNNSGLDAVCINGHLYAVYNPIGENWGARTPLVISKSEDNGTTWSETLTLEDTAGEFSYPSVIEADDFLHVVYTYNRKSVMYTRIYV
ncbi:MAG: exo-alpha-sialidase [Oscillospiraceae bacterium]|nr:exo-alpha-sialidase [Oscillospiraceae bacterium]